LFQALIGIKYIELNSVLEWLFSDFYVFKSCVQWDEFIEAIKIKHENAGYNPYFITELAACRT